MFLQYFAIGLKLPVYTVCMNPVDLNFWSICNVKICRKSEYNILGQPIAFESQTQPTEFVGPEICRQFLYVAVIPTIIIKIVID